MSDNDDSPKIRLKNVLVEYQPPTHIHKVCHEATSVDDLEKSCKFLRFQSNRALGHLHMQSTIDPSRRETSNDNTKDSDSTRRYGLSGFESGSFSNKLKLALSNDTGKSSKCLGRDKLFPYKVCISAHAELSLILLSTIIDYFDERARDERHMIVSNMSQSETLSLEMSSSSRSSSRDNVQHVDDSLCKDEHRGSHFVHTESEWISTLIVNTIASISHLMKTLLLFNEKEKVRIFDYSAVKKS